MKSVRIKPRKVDETFEEYFRSLVRPRYEFIDKRRDALENVKHPKDEQIKELKNMITTDKKIDNVWKLCEENYIKEHPNGRCSMCSKRWKCKSKIQSNIHDNKGDLLPSAYQVLTTRCSNFEPIIGYGKASDYDMKRLAHSTTVEVTDTTSSGYLYYSNANYNTARTTGVASVNGTDYLQIGQNFDGGNYHIYRSFAIYDISAIPVGSIVSAAKLKLYAASDASDTDFDVVIQDGQPDHPQNPFGNGDYSYLYYSGDYGSWNTLGYIGASYNEIPFTDFTTLNLGGITKHTLRSNNDILDNEPINSEYVIFEGPTLIGGNDPKIEVTYDVLAAPNPFIDSWYVNDVSPY